MSKLWVPAEDDPRNTGHDVRGERDVLLDYLAHYRMTLAMKCEGLDAEQLARRSVPPSTLSLLGLLRHMAKVEAVWFREVMEGDPSPRLYGTSDVPDSDFDGATADPEVVTEAWESWRREVANGEEYVVRTPDLSTLGQHRSGPLELREVLVHLIEEYARHCGHADLLRECIDGRTGL